MSQDAEQIEAERPIGADDLEDGWAAGDGDLAYLVAIRRAGVDGVVEVPGGGQCRR